MNVYKFNYVDEGINVYLNEEELSTIRINSNGKVNRIDYKDFISQYDNLFLQHFIEELGFTSEYTKDLSITVKFEDGKSMPHSMTIKKDGEDYTLEDMSNGYVINSFLRETVLGV